MDEAMLYIVGYILPADLAYGRVLAVVGGQAGPGGESAQMEALAAGLEDGQWARLEGHEKQLAQLSNQVHT
jgi:hypothetical protein